MTNLREESIRNLPVFDGLFDENADVPVCLKGFLLVYDCFGWQE